MFQNIQGEGAGAKKDDQSVTLSIPTQQALARGQEVRNHHRLVTLLQHICF